MLRKSYMLLYQPHTWIPRGSLIAILVLTCSLAVQDSPYRPGPNRYPKFDGKQAEPGIAYGEVPSLKQDHPVSGVTLQRWADVESLV